MSERGRAESPCKSTLKRSDSQESKYSGDSIFDLLESEDYDRLDQTELDTFTEFLDSSAYRTESPPSSPGKRKADIADDIEDEPLMNKIPRSDGLLSRTESWFSNITDTSSSGSASPPLPYPLNNLHIVSFSPPHQPYFDKHLPWGAQWEIARLITSKRLKYEDMKMQDLTPLSGKRNAAAAPEIEKLFCPSSNTDLQGQSIYLRYFATELGSHDPWSELDIEEQRLKEDPFSGLGCNSLHNDWYGGKIAFTARVRQNEGKRGYSLQLEKPELSTSTRFARRWGSRRFIRVRIPDDIIYDRDNDLAVYFKQDFVIHGRIFRSLYSKEHSVFLIELDEKTNDGMNRIPNPTGGLSFATFLEWHNPMAFNRKQTLAKWSARMALGLSNSVPGLQFQAENIHEIDDIYSPEGQAAASLGKSPEAKFILTDGTGYCNYAALDLLRNKFNWDRLPSAIQFRMFGAKGLLLLHPTEEMRSDTQPQVWLRPSQQKIKYEKSPALDRTHMILDILRRAQFRTPARLSTEIIVNLAENGVSYDILQSLMNVGLDEIAASLTTWGGPYAMQHLWNTVSKVNINVFYARAAREAVGKSRLLGLSSRDWEEDEQTNEDDATGDFPKSKPFWTDEISGCPSGLEETAMVLLDSGFEPQSCSLLARLLKDIFKKALTSFIDKYKIIVPQSGEAWMVPDPYGVLEPGQIFLKASKSLFEYNGIYNDHLTGPVLITRHPCRVPSDVQKVVAVWRDELSRYSDVIVCSSRGSRSLASMLGGGDYDGDTAHVIWEPRIVEAFQNADMKFADPPATMDDVFQKNTPSVEEFLGKFGECAVNKKMQEMQDYLLTTLRFASLVGQYSAFHDVVVYRLGYSHDEAWRLAYMFCAVLDSSKTGKVLKPLQLRKDRQRYGASSPEWKRTLQDEREDKIPDDRTFTRRETKIVFIMDTLKKGGRLQYHSHLQRFEAFISNAQKQFLAQNNRALDDALTAPANELRNRAEQLYKVHNCDVLKKELELLQNHVKDVHNEYKRYKALFRPSDSPGGDRSFAKKRRQEAQDKLRKVSLNFARTPEGIVWLCPDEIDQFKASYAYELDSEREKFGGDGRFAFDVAMRHICLIKAKSLGTFKAVSSRFYSVLEMSPVFKNFAPPPSAGYTYTP